MTKITHRTVIVLWALCMVLPASRSLGWVEAGHKVIALVAWEDLSPDARGKIAEILKQHPRYEKDLLAGLPQGADDATTARHAFAVAATWPDLVRSQGHPMHFVANHPAWHYIDIPYCIAGQAAPATRPSDEPGPHNVVEALSKSVADLRDSSVSASDKAIALCWLLHLGGDIHQPLHACMLVSPQFPDGDQGGNGILVLRDPPYQNSQMNLHLLWDKLPGDYKSDEFDNSLAVGLRADPKLSREQLKDALAVKDFAAWARDSHELAVEHAYLSGKLEGAVASRGRSETRQAVPGVPPHYVEQAEQVAIRQVVLAGYRIADQLNAIAESNAASNH